MIFLRETLGQRRLCVLAAARLQTDPAVAGLAHVPADGAFVVAVNHYRAGSTLEVLAATIHACSSNRPDLTNQFLIVAGRAELPSRVSGLVKILRSAASWILDDRWSKNCLRVPMRNQRASAGNLREWRRRTAIQPAILFPEGCASLTFERIRPGSGRWLSSLQVPVLPTAVWWDQDRCYVSIGPPLSWSRREDLKDLQLGLAIASLLPAELAPSWQAILKRWQMIHGRGAMPALSSEDLAQISSISGSTGP